MGRIFSEEPEPKLGVAYPDTVFTQIGSEMQNLSVEWDEKSSDCFIFLRNKI